MYIDFKKNCKEYLKEAKKKGYQKRIELNY